MTSFIKKEKGWLKLCLSRDMYFNDNAFGKAYLVLNIILRSLDLIILKYLEKNEISYQSSERKRVWRLY